jgi:Family of unknown function (DUF5360)
MVADLKMPKNLSVALKLLDGGMLLYWAFASVACIGWLTLPKELMYDGYGTTVIDAWNWSFAPLDVMFSLTGLGSVWLAQKGDDRWRPLAIISLTLMFCAGLMAISFWALTAYFEPSWWTANILLMTVACWWLPKLVKSK